MDKYGRNAAFVAYGATLFEDPDERALDKYELVKYSYNLVIARMEPENNIETIIRGHLLSASPNVLFIVGHYKNKYGKYLQKKYEKAGIIFHGTLFDIHELNQLRYFSSIYFHGHSVGGTNPSLLEAMASQALIAAHDNGFNRDILGSDGFYFIDSSDIRNLLDTRIQKNDYSEKIKSNLAKIQRNFSWVHITDLLEKCLYESKSSEKDTGLMTTKPLNEFIP